MGRLFGTDGVRGLANDSLSPELALRVSAAAAQVLSRGERRAVAVVGRDPRASGEMLEAAVTAGLTSAGVDVLSVGVLPTPAVAYLTAAYDACLGVMISASHNPMPDNGIKIFAAGGHKLDDAVEDRIEDLVRERAFTRPTGAAIGRVLSFSGADGHVDDHYSLAGTHERYVEHLVEATGRDLSGLTVVVDCAHGAASDVGPAAYREAGARVVAINAEPNGLNINDRCGSTHLEQIQHAVRAHGADLGLAHDGDADRCLAVDATGAVVDGDAIMAILALAMHESGELARNTLVATVMSNLGLHIAMREAGITMLTTAVGDRYVLEELRRGGYSLGGEQSGHVVFPRYGTTGDGVLTGLKLMARMAETGRALADLAAVVRTVPQVLVNVPVTDKSAVAAAPEIRDAVAEAERVLGETGRVLLRPSGTEQLVRVMVEATDLDRARQLADDLAKRVAAV
ncbi:phosphoglucosamine mutase [Nocardia terpenica]|uniref:phosphoglucosamine mutase n=1 Tax=Nocardia terpenica TaxID=455432 RepID=UPI0018931E49|nr:phosphoglucosamine mutase [Nocardia terpenica]MBF6061758.1 phosphoglucosamine mutase [Nocardia terpenica]MBF6107447.1 phosphoglucosamine mutase [Nocardia terpenica]MBF6110178.1 phosphoglucosamine mutase [Nocardia terpenica]MBF6122310.1 phosphoglucosamine mutase [Nocardia terpenica]MBF6151514.1 phosphoglucosamine mutase [Nocardia terpenica]